MHSADMGAQYAEIAVEICEKMKELDVIERIDHMQQEFDATHNPAVRKFVQMCGRMIAHLLEGVPTESAGEDERWQKETKGVYMAKQYFWEEIHTVYWKDVSSVDRDGYALSCLACSFEPVTKEVSLADRLRQLDMGLLLGAELFRCVLQSVAQIVHAHIAPSWSPVFDHPHHPTSIRQLHTEHSVPVLRQPSLHEFLQFVLQGKPVIIRGMMDDWPCMAKWKDISYLRHLMGYRTVPVEIGSHYLNEDWGQQLLTVNEFIDRFLTGAAEPRGYLAQHQLLDQIHALHEDIVVPDYCSLLLPDEEAQPAAGDTIVNAWFGPSSTVSPLHNDPYHNLFAQVVGCKYFRLFAPTETSKLYPRPGRMSNNSMVDVAAPDLAQFPLFGEAEFSECIVNEGELLYIPPKYWHYVRAVTPCPEHASLHPLQEEVESSAPKRQRADPIYSFSISFWWGIRREDGS